MVMNKKFFARLVLRFIFYSYFIPAAIYFCDPIFTILTKEVVAKNTYISEITGDPVFAGLVKDSLDYFNYLGNNEIIDYVPKYGKWSRPTKIIVKPFTAFWEQGLAGQTDSEIDECIIYINEDESNMKEFTKTVIHEYLHCLGYDHVPSKEDVMYYSTTPGINVYKSLKKYAEEIKKAKNGYF